MGTLARVALRHGMPSALDLSPAGPAWVDRFPTSRSVADLASPFRERVTAWLAALDAAGATVTITATRRPAPRAWLMHYAWDVAKGRAAPGDVPARADVPIVWTLDGARAMVRGYGLVVRPSLTSRHIDGRAIDVRIEGIDRAAAEALGAENGVHPLEGDAVHWSDDGK